MGQEVSPSCPFHIGPSAPMSRKKQTVAKDSLRPVFRSALKRRAARPAGEEMATLGAYLIHFTPYGVSGEDGSTPSSPPSASARAGRVKYFSPLLYFFHVY